MDALNYHHLRLFQAVAHEGNLTRASQQLELTPQTVSAQIREFESALGESLFTRTGRRLEITEAGMLTLRYANDIFSLGHELRETLRGQPSGRPLKVTIGSTNILPKLIVHRIIEPALRLDQPVQILCREGASSEMLADLAVHRLDVVLSDAPIPTGVNVRAYNHLLGSCGITFMASPDLARRLARGFPGSLDGESVLLPSDDSAVRRDLDRWFTTHEVQPEIFGEFEDIALLKAFGQAGEGFFMIPSVIADEVARQYEVEAFGHTEDVCESYYAISIERRVRHPAVVAICEAARAELFS